MFGKKRVDYSAYVADLNAHLTLDDLTKHFKDPFIEALVPKGVPSGADVECTLYPGDDDEPIGARIDFWAPEVSDESEAACVQVLESLGAPKGSQLVAPNLQRYTPLGGSEGMGVWVGTVLTRFPELLGDRGKVLSHWEGTRPVVPGHFRRHRAVRPQVAVPIARAPEPDVS